MDLLFSIKHPSRLHDVTFCKHVNGEGDVLLAGGEDHKTTVYSIPRDTTKPIIIAEMIGHSNRSVFLLVGCQSSKPINVTYRIKAVQTIGVALPSSSGRTSTIIACTVSSDGNVNLYDIAAIPQQPSTDAPQTIKQIEPLTTYDSKGTRLTCVTLADGDMDINGIVNGKRKRENDEDGNRNENGDEDKHEHRHESDQEESESSGSDEEELEDKAENEEEDQSDSD